ncbi:hypothetical protein IQ241_06300 [Romeria aff. gracilis LEGE 07310]|uniref:Tic20 family protein Ycf60 n=1 Tax=Vasconcelosia minhoensis LEGE 07310 TaxID=915328 RepID=A0A8J7AUF2_9CYAN|nr:Tic20 family protein [Romeria gracilis]MBE9076908.1 hypothetical protein [Romeria aff. gracilis LEGE 07310]
MTWRGSTTALDRVFAALPYLLPLMATLQLGQYFISFISQFPALVPIVQVLFILIAPVAAIYGAIPFAGLIVFFLLIFLVVNNTDINRFIRFNTLQAILLSFILFICSLILGILGNGLPLPFLIETLANVLFLGGLAAIVYSVVQSLMGQYAEIPTISEAVHMQLR